MPSPFPRCAPILPDLLRFSQTLRSLSLRLQHHPLHLQRDIFRRETRAPTAPHLFPKRYLCLIAVGYARIVRGGKLRSGQESLNAVPVDNKSAFIRFCNGEFEYSFLLHRELRLVPDEGLPRFTQRKLQIPFCVISAYDLRRDGVTEVYVL